MIPNIIENFNKSCADLKTSNTITEERFNLIVNEFSFNFPLNLKSTNKNLGYLGPREWFAEEHKNNNLHEPGLVNILLVLAEKFKNKKVRFWDIGALYGYFSILVMEIFNNVEVFSIEANPYSCNYIKGVKKELNYKCHHIINTFIDTENREKQKKYISGYSFLNTSEYYQVIFKNIIKRFLNYLRQKKYDIIKPERVHIDSTTLTSLIGNRNQFIDILKIDTEGYQASFLPPAAQNLIDNKSIILLEFDELKELKKFNSSNQKICAPFLENGYKLFWLNHRIKGSNLEMKNKIDISMEFNSLALLIPSEFI